MKDNHSDPLISIIIPTYNRWNFLQQAIASVMAQTYTNWELFVVDDGSTDQTKEGIEAINDKRIHLLSVKHCGNIALLRNTGVKASNGDWIAFLDSDDIWVPGKLKLQLEYLQQRSFAWGFGGFELMDETGQPIPAKTIEHAGPSGWITKELLLNEASPTIGSLMMSRNLFEDVKGFDTASELIWREDYELVLRLSLKAEAAALPAVLVKVREHRGRSTNAIDDAHKRTAFVYAHFSNLCPAKKLKRIARRRQAHHVTEMAVITMKQKKYGKAIRQLNSAFWKGDKLRHMISAVRRGIRKTNDHH